MTDRDYMSLALELAKRGCGHTSPNPMVGCVIVKDNKIIGKGYHRRYGELHAERNALASCTESASGAVMYVTLEPCCHYGKTPPCTEAVIDSGVKKVVIGSHDPNPLVSGKGAEILRSHGIEVVEGVLKDECDRLNRVFFHYIQNKTPYVVMKYAMTMDGKIAAHTGASKWITGEEARKNVHEDRNRYSAIMVGVNTVINDNPSLTCRIENGENPVRIICDTNLRTPPASQVVATAKTVRTIIATAVGDEKRTYPYLKAGCEIMTLPLLGGHIDLNTLMKKLGEIKIDSILLEGGGTLNWAALSNGIVNLVQCYIAPKLLGGANAKTPIGGIGVDTPDDAYMLKNTVIKKIGDDFLLESEVASDVHGNC